jgi:predicted regulator of Ras-like GTPase activity (Roadblock/LC7/MglB family)
VAVTAHDLALRYLLELSADIRGALLTDRDGALLGSAGSLPVADLDRVAARLAAEAGNLCASAGEAAGRAAVEIDVLAETGALFVLGEGDRVMVCVTNRSVHPGLIFYDMHAVLRDLDRAAAAEERREGAVAAVGKAGPVSGGGSLPGTAAANGGMVTGGGSLPGTAAANGGQD